MSDLNIETSKNPRDFLGESFGIGQNNHTALVGIIYFLLSVVLATIVDEIGRVVISGKGFCSLLAKHHMRYNHQIDLMNVEIVDRSSAWRQRLILEAWHSLRDTNAINEHIALPNVYNNIKNL